MAYGLCLWRASCRANHIEGSKHKKGMEKEHWLPNIKVSACEFVRTHKCALLLWVAQKDSYTWLILSFFLFLLNYFCSLWLLLMSQKALLNVNS